MGEKGVFDFVEQFIPPAYLLKLYNFAENCFLLYTKACCKLFLIPMRMSVGEKVIAKSSAKKQVVHYAVLSLLVLSMTHKFGSLLDRLVSVGLDMTAFFIAATFLCYLVSLSISSSVLFLPDETIDLVNGCQKILANCFEEGEDFQGVFIDTKTTVVTTSLGIVAMVIGTAISLGISFVLPDLPVGYYRMARDVELVSANSLVPSVVWMLLFCPLELATYMLPAFRSGWAPSVLSALIMVVIRSAEQLRSEPFLHFRITT